MIRPDWPAPSGVRAFVTTRGEALPPLPSAPLWLKQVHGRRVVRAEEARGEPEADAAVATEPGIVCVVKAADCLPVLFADDAASVVGAAHAGWRGLSAGVLEATVDEMRVPGGRLMAWLGPAIGRAHYEVGAEVRDAFLAHDPAAESAFAANRPGHWLLDLYAAARLRLAARGVERVYGGGFCTYADAARFPSWRRERGEERIAALVWLESAAP